MLNIRLTELPELTSIDSANVFVYGANTASANTSHKIRLNSFTTDYTIANAAFLQANIAYNTGFNANNALLIAGLAYSQSNNAFTRSNNALTQVTAAYDYANTVFVHANSAFNRANSTLIHTNAAFTFANTSLIYSTAGFNTANAAFLRANAAFTAANSSLTIAQLASDTANTAVSNSAFTVALAAFKQANSATALAQAAYNQANSSIGGTSFAHAQAAFNKANTVGITANAAFDAANTAQTRADQSVRKSGDTITGVVTAPTASNTTSNNMVATTQYVQNSISQRLGGAGPVVKAYAIISVTDVTFTTTLTKGFNISSVSRLGSGRYLITFANPLSSADYAVSASVSTFNPNNLNRNFDHTINIEATTTTSITINTGDPGAVGNNTGQDPAKLWVTVFE